MKGGRGEVVVDCAVGEVGLVGQIGAHAAQPQRVEGAFVADIGAGFDRLQGSSEGQVPREQPFAGADRAHCEAVSFQHGMGEGVRVAIDGDPFAGFEAAGGDGGVVAGHRQAGDGGKFVRVSGLHTDSPTGQRMNIPQAATYCKASGR